MTVPACFRCNHEYSNIDQELRNVIGVMNDNNDMQADMTTHAIESILQEEYRTANEERDIRQRYIPFVGRYGGFTFDGNRLEQLHLKNFKGIFYEKYSFPFPQKMYSCYTVTRNSGNTREQQLWERYGQAISNEFRQYPDWEFSGHADIFKYKFKAVGRDNQELIMSDDFRNAEIILGIIMYHNMIEVIFIANRKL